VILGTAREQSQRESCAGETTQLLPRPCSWKPTFSTTHRPKDTMHKLNQLLITALLTLFVATLGASIATALRSIRVNGISESEEVLASSRLTFGTREGGGALPANSQIICDVTLLRTISTLIPKRAGVLTGRVTGIRINIPSCRTGLGTVERVQPLALEGAEARRTGEAGGTEIYDTRFESGGRATPAENWKLVFDSFQGTLPEIEGINIHLTAYRSRVTISGIRCLWGRGESVFALISINRTTSAVTGVTSVLERTSLARVEGSFLCPAAGPASFTGNFSITPGNLEIDLL
jgi:hypothetical protein